jgi:hypothetical protein
MAYEATKVLAIQKMNRRRNLQTKIRIDILQKQRRRGRGGAEIEGIFKFRISEMPFPGLWGRFDRILMVRKKRFSMSKFTTCLQFSSTKWAKAHLINYTVYWRSCRKVWVI